MTKYVKSVWFTSPMPTIWNIFTPIGSFLILELAIVLVFCHAKIKKKILIFSKPNEAREQARMAQGGSSILPSFSTGYWCC